MRGKKAKLIRSVAFDLAYEARLARETEYQTTAKYRDSWHPGVVHVTNCERAVIKQTKGIARTAKNMPLKLLETIALNAISIEGA